MHSNVSFGTTTLEAWNERGDKDVTMDDVSKRKIKREKVRRNDNTKKIVHSQRREKNMIDNLPIILCIIYKNI